MRKDIIIQTKEEIQARIKMCGALIKHSKNAKDSVRYWKNLRYWIEALRRKEDRMGRMEITEVYDYIYHETSLKFFTNDKDQIPYHIKYIKIAYAETEKEEGIWFESYEEYIFGNLKREHIIIDRR